MKRGLIVFSIGLFMCIVGATSYIIILNSKSTDNKIDPSKQSVLQKEHCLENICINSLEITEQEGYCEVTGKIINKLDSDMKSEFVNIRFNLANGKYVIQAYKYPDFNAKEEKHLGFHVPATEIIDTKDYEIEQPTKEELEFYYQSMESSE